MNCLLAEVIIAVYSSDEPEVIDPGSSK